VILLWMKGIVYSIIYEEATPFIITTDQKTFEHKLAKVKPSLDKIEGVYT